MNEKPGNIGLYERMATGAVGGFIAMWAAGKFKRHDLRSGSIGAATSAALLARSLSGYCPIYAALLERGLSPSPIDQKEPQLEAIQESALPGPPEELTLPAFEEAVRTRHRDSEALQTVGSYVRVPQF